SRSRCFINSFSFFSSKDLPFNSPFSDYHRHVVDCGVLRKWKSVDGFDSLFERVLKFLCDVDTREETADFSFNLSMFEWAGRSRLTFFVQHRKRAGGFTIRCRFGLSAHSKVQCCYEYCSSDQDNASWT